MSSLQGHAHAGLASAVAHQARTPIVTAIRTGTPAHALPQAEAQRVAASQFPDIESSPGLLAVFDHAEIDERQLARPAQWYVEPHGFAEKNAVYCEEALALSSRLATAALAMRASPLARSTRSCSCRRRA